jgi:hypothetical protein
MKRAHKVKYKSEMALVGVVNVQVYMFVVDLVFFLLPASLSSLCWLTIQRSGTCVREGKDTNPLQKDKSNPWPGKYGRNLAHHASSPSTSKIGQEIEVGGW